MGFFGNSMGFFGNSVDQLMARGVGWAVKGQFDRAVADFEEVIRLDPKCADAFYNRANAYAEQRQYDRAIADYEAAIKLNPKDVAAAIKSRAAVIALKKERDKKSGADAPATPKTAPAKPDAGDVVLADKGEDDTANADFDEAIRRHPKGAGAFGLRGAVSAAKVQYDRTIADISDAAEHDSKEASVFNGRGCKYLIKGKFDRAIAEFDEAIRLDPNFSMAIEMRAMAIKWKNELGAGTEILEQKSDSAEPIHLVEHSHQVIEHSHQADGYNGEDIDSHHVVSAEGEPSGETAKEENKEGTKETDNAGDIQFLESPKLVAAVETSVDDLVDLADEPVREAADPALNDIAQEFGSGAVVEADEVEAPTFGPMNRPPSEDEQKIRSAIYKQAEVLEAIYRDVPPGRYRSLALTSLEESVMWIVKGLPG